MGKLALALVLIGITASQVSATVFDWSKVVQYQEQEQVQEQDQWQWEEQKTGGTHPDVKTVSEPRTVVATVALLIVGGLAVTLKKKTA